MRRTIGRVEGVNVSLENRYAEAHLRPRLRGCDGGAEEGEAQTQMPINRSNATTACWERGLPHVT